jgi:hypothetical protein
VERIKEKREKADLIHVLTATKDADEWEFGTGNFPRESDRLLDSSP